MLSFYPITTKKFVQSFMPLKVTVQKVISALLSAILILPLVSNTYTDKYIKINLIESCFPPKCVAVVHLAYNRSLIDTTKPF